MVWVVGETVDEMTVEVVGSEVWTAVLSEPEPGAVVTTALELWDVTVLEHWVGLVTEPWLVIEFQLTVSWVLVVIGPEAGVVEIGPGVWVGLVAESWFELVIELQVMFQFLPATLSEMIVQL